MNFDILGYILESIKSCISRMKDIYLFSNYGDLYFSQLSLYDIFIGLSVGSVLLTIFLNFFGESAEDLADDDSPNLDSDDY